MNGRLLWRRGYYHATDAWCSRRVEAFQGDDKDFLPMTPKTNQLIFMRRSLESMLPLQAIRIDIGADCAKKVLHAFSFTLADCLPCFIDDRMPARAFFEGNQHIGTGNGYHKLSWIYMDPNSLAHAGTIVRDGNSFPARARDGADSGLEESRGMNFAEVKVLDCEEFFRTRNVSEVHKSILPQRTGVSLQSLSSI